MQLNTVLITNPSLQRASSLQRNSTTITFGASQSAKNSSNPSGTRKALVLTLATIILAVPIILCRIPVGRIRPLKSLQDKFKTLMQTKLNPKPVLDKLMGKAQTSNSGINIVR